MNLKLNIFTYLGEPIWKESDGREFLGKLSASRIALQSNGFVYLVVGLPGMRFYIIT